MCKKIAFACCLGNVVDACNHVVRMNTILTSTFTYVLPMTMNLSSGNIDKTSYGYEQSRLKGHTRRREGLLWASHSLWREGLLWASHSKATNMHNKPRRLETQHIT